MHACVHARQKLKAMLTNLCFSFGSLSDFLGFFLGSFSRLLYLLLCGMGGLLGRRLMKQHTEMTLSRRQQRQNFLHFNALPGAVIYEVATADT